MHGSQSNYTINSISLKHIFVVSKPKIEWLLPLSLKKFWWRRQKRNIDAAADDANANVDIPYKTTIIIITYSLHKFFF